MAGYGCAMDAASGAASSDPAGSLRREALCAFVLTFLLPRGSQNWLLNVFGLQPGLWNAWFPLLPVWQLASYGFLHDVGSPFHVLMNMLFPYSQKR